MATINLRIKKQSRMFYFIGPFNLSRSAFTVVNLNLLEEESLTNLKDSLEGEIIESDVSLNEAVILLGFSGNGPSMFKQISDLQDEIEVAATTASYTAVDIQARDNLLPLGDGASVHCEDVGDGTWEEYTVVNGAFQLISSEASNMKTWLFTQSTAEDTWNITHPFGSNPTSILILDADGNDIEGDISYKDSDNLDISFTEAITGTAQLSK